MTDQERHLEQRARVAEGMLRDLATSIVTDYKKDRLTARAKEALRYLLTRERSAVPHV